MTFDELLQLLRTAESAEALDKRREDIASVIPMVRIMFDYDQDNHAHQYDLWMHTAHVIAELPKGIEDDMLYLAALLHDIGKPASRTRGKDPADVHAHFYGHPEKSYVIVRDEILPELDKAGIAFSGPDRERLLYYVRHHDDHANRAVRDPERYEKEIPEDTFRKLMILEAADGIAHIMLPKVEARIALCREMEERGYGPKE